MTLGLIRLFRVRLRGWRLYVILVAVVFLVAWGLMAAYEPPRSTIDDPGTYWWWFVVTAFTVGYGDVFPVSTGGRIGALLVMATAIGVVASLVGDLIEWAAARKSKRLKGLIEVNITDHFVILGYAAGRTDRLIEELCVDPSNRVVLVAAMDQVSEHPMPDQPRVSLVRGELTDQAVLGRASLGSARAAIVDSTDVDDDTRALLALLINRLNPDLHIVVAARDVDRMVRLLSTFGPGFECAQWHDVRMLSEAAQDPGITQFHTDLKTEGSGTDTYSLRLPEAVRGRPLGDFLYPLKDRLNVTVCALRDGDQFINNPPLATPLEPGMTLYYLASQRLAWSDIEGAIA